MSVVQLFFGFSGRLSRREFIFGYLFLFALSLGVTALLLPLYGFTLETYFQDEGVRIFQIDLLVAGLFLWPDLALGYKRFHDWGWSGKPYGVFSVAILLWSFIGASGFVSEKPLENDLFLYAGSLILLFIVVMLGLMIFKKGRRGDNQYGADPLGRAGTAL